MPLFSEHIANMYYSGSPSYSAPYSSYSSVIPHGSSYSASYLNPGGTYSTHSSLSSYSRPTPLTSSRWVTSSGRNYSPMLGTISERGSATPPRINSPRRIHFTKRNYTPTPTYTPRPININTADIDVSKNKYRHKVESPAPPPLEPEPSVTNGPFMPRVDGKPETGIDSSPGIQRSTIRRGRTVVRLHTIKRKDRDSPRKSQSELSQDNQEVKDTESSKSNIEKVNTPGEIVENESNESVRWRDKLAEDLAYKDKREKKTIGAKLVEKFIVKDKDSDSDGSFKEKKQKQQAENVLVTDSSKPSSRSPDRRCSMEMLAEQANLLDSLIRGENLSTISLDLSKVGLPDSQENKNHLQVPLKRRKSDNLENPLQTTKSDYSLHQSLKSFKDPKNITKRRSLKKSSSGGSICRLDSITEFPKEHVTFPDLPVIEENNTISKRKSVKPLDKPKLKAVITSSVEISPPLSPLKFKVDVTVEEKPRSPRKEITYSTTVEDSIPAEITQKMDKEKPKNIIKNITKTLTENVDAPSPEPDDGNFWDKIGKRETIYLMKRKQIIEDSRERNRRALFWFPEEEEEEFGNFEDANASPQSSFDSFVSEAENKEVPKEKPKNEEKEMNLEKCTPVSDKIIPSDRSMVFPVECNVNVHSQSTEEQNLTMKSLTDSAENTTALIPIKKAKDNMTKQVETKLAEDMNKENLKNKTESIKEPLKATAHTKFSDSESKGHTEPFKEMAETKSHTQKITEGDDIIMKKDTKQVITNKLQSEVSQENVSYKGSKNVNTSDIILGIDKKKNSSKKKEDIKKNPQKIEVDSEIGEKVIEENHLIKKTANDEKKEDNICVNCGKISEQNMNTKKSDSVNKISEVKKDTTNLEKTDQSKDFQPNKGKVSPETIKIIKTENDLKGKSSTTVVNNISENSKSTGAIPKVPLSMKKIEPKTNKDIKKDEAKSSEISNKPVEKSGSLEKLTTDESKISETTTKIDPTTTKSTESIVIEPENIPKHAKESETELTEDKKGEDKKADITKIYKDEVKEETLVLAPPIVPEIVKAPTPRKPVKEEAATRPLIATPRPLQKKVPQIIHSSSSSESSSEEESSDDEDADESDASDDSTEFFECENNPDGRTSTGSNDSGFDSSAPTSPAGFVHIKKGGESAGASASVPAQANATDVLEQELEQSTAYGLFRKTGRFTPPARSIPRFRKYTIEDFHFIKVLGKGSFGKVLLAELRDTEYYYAVKCLKKDVVLEDDDVECTLIERKVLALGTNHPYLCHLFATFQTDSHLFFVMEYLNGGDLMFHIQQSGRFPEARSRFYAAEIVSGLKFLHKRGIVYRDLKLDNILLDFDGHVRIADFGMCKLQIYLDNTADTFCGTPDYMAPEIIKGLKYNQAVDWWSFGVLLYEMLIGQSPFSGCDEDELFWSICNEMPSYPRFLSTEALTILTRLLDKDAQTRLGGGECMHGDVRDQDFFHAIHWDRLERRELEAPFRPRVRHPLDTQYFDRAFTGERPRLTAVEPQVLRSMDQEPFRGFSYTNPNATDR